MTEKELAEKIQGILAEHLSEQCQCDGLGRASYVIARLVGTTEQDWQPIETAPRNGKSVLLWKQITQEHYVAAWLVGDHPGWCTPDAFEIFQATHWMPLPPPPKVEP